jgi:hypothetical protein
VSRQFPTLLLLLLLLLLYYEHRRHFCWHLYFGNIAGRHLLINLKERANLRDLGVDGRLVLKWIFLHEMRGYVMHTVLNLRFP